MYKKNTSALVAFALCSRYSRAPITAGTVTGTVSIDAASPVALTNTPAHAGDGTWTVTLTAAEMNGDEIALAFTHAAGEAYRTIRTTTRLVSEVAVNVTLGAVQSIASPGQRLSSPRTLEMHQGEQRAFALTFQDADGNPVDLSGRTLRFVAHDENTPAHAVFQVDHDAITVSGTGNEIATVVVGTTESATAHTNLRWALWDLTNDAVLGYGAFHIVSAAKATS